MDASVTPQSRHTLLDTAFFWQGNQPILTLQWAAPLIFSSCCNSRLQNEPRVIRRWAHRSTCCHFLHLGLFLLALSLFILHSHKLSLFPGASLFCLSVAVSFSCSPHLMFWLPGWLLLILSHWFSFHSPASPHLFSEWLTFACIFLFPSQSLPFTPLLFPSLLLYPLLPPTSLILSKINSAQHSSTV